MESMSSTEAADELAASVTARDSFAQRLTLPPEYSLITGIGNAALVYGVAVGNSTWRFASVAFVVGLIIAVTAMAIAMRRFRARNGAWVGGLSGPRSTRVVAAWFLGFLLACIVGATWLMVAGHPILSALVALSVVPGTAVGDRWWMARYRASR